jgi:hypothetical protein
MSTHMLQSPSKTDRGSLRERSPGGGTLARSNSVLSFWSIRSVDGENPPGHYVVVYDTLEKRIYMESPENVQSSSDMVYD